MFKVIDSFIDAITMYRLLMYYLIGLLLAAVGLSFAGDLHYKPLSIITSTLILVTACWGINKVLAYIFKAPASNESSILTALILALIITPDPTGFGFTFLLAASGLAMASKYLLVIRRIHLFNPAAIAVVLTALGPKQSASWWVGTAAMVPFVIIGGILVTRKIRRSSMVISFLLSSVLVTALYSVFGKTDIISSLHNLVATTALFFLGFVMLTEPLTSPPTRGKQAWYGIIVGALFPSQVHILNFYATPEIALIVGNLFSYVVSPKTKLFPVLKNKVKIAAHTTDFIFHPGAPLAFEPGQYMEWTLPHPKTDSRGNRRYFTLASSPTESDLRIGVKFYEPGSSYKQALLNLTASTPIVAAQIAGDFVMPKDPAKKLVFIAGGIGVTPFRSMVKYLIDKGERRSITFFYSAKTQADIAYQSIFDEAEIAIGLKTRYILTTTDKEIGEQLIRAEVPDYLERIFYISGTHEMVVAMQDMLSKLGVATNHIKVDFFPGYA